MRNTVKKKERNKDKSKQKKNKKKTRSWIVLKVIAFDHIFLRVPHLCHVEDMPQGLHIGSIGLNTRNWQ